MSEFKGTPGKWRYSSTWGDIKTESGGLIAEVVVNGDEDDNGALLAEAPELFDSLKLVVEKYEQGFVLNESEIGKCKSVLKKALGQ